MTMAISALSALAFLVLAYASPIDNNSTYPSINGTQQPYAPSPMADITPVPQNLSMIAIAPSPDQCTVYNSSITTMFHEYLVDECPPRQRFSEQNPEQCEKNIEGRCTNSFCQTRTKYTYAREAPIMGTYCTGPIKCSTTPIDRPIVNDSPLYPPVALAMALRKGVSGGFDPTGPLGFGRDAAARIAHYECGYFTFVPILKTVCGTWSHAYRVGTGCSDPVNDQDVCVSKHVARPDGSLEGETIFVKAHCGTRLPLELDQQDILYRQQGVALAGAEVAAITNDWTQTTCNVYYKGFWDHFEIKGKNWQWSKLGVNKYGKPNGSKMNWWMGTCGALTMWRFHYHEHDDSWSAYGNLPIGVRSCVGHQIIGLGALTRGNCAGPG